MSWSINLTVSDNESSETGINSLGFKNNIAALKNVILASSKVKTLTLTKSVANRWRGDLGGWLLRQGIDMKYHFTIAWVNGFEDPSMYDGTTLTLQVPDTSYIDDLLSNYTTEVASS